ncbi:hypothetical protein C8F04DRAFT_1310909 [Mycena alexandri]|uniref:Uncharacterized protein n=1 Tax=Mycena alexandri TaxID=1745969 RepID=A0AAD6T6T5_9AGAR|nr:hypothetical protein C8F04DRAFT_1310909 [Mycena alexandri]
MHRTLGILEIVENICLRLEESEDGLLRDDGRTDFAALGRTSRIFEGPALNVLWRKQDTLNNLLKCFPPDLWEEVIVSGGRKNKAVRLTRVPQSEDWERLLLYARRIRDLTLRSPPTWLSAPFPAVDVFEAIESHLAAGYLCPNLQSIIWDGGPNSPVFPYVRLFLGPQTTRAHPEVSRNASDLSVLSTLAIPYDKLKSFRLGSPLHDMPLIRGPSATLAMKLVHVEHLGLDTLDRAALEHLSGLPSLKSLDLSVTDQQDLGPPSSLTTRSRNPTFPALHTVQFFASSIQFAIEFVNMLSQCPLEDFTLGTDVLASNITMGEFFSALAAGVFHRMLTSLLIHEVDDGVTTTPTPPAGTIGNYIIRGPVLALLFCFSNLTTVRLTTPAGIDIDDTTAGDIARAWPKIRSLELGSCTDAHHPSSMTLRGLRAFATYCENLTYLGITLDASTVPPFDNSPATRISQLRLRSLDVAASPIADSTAVSRFVSGLFPGLETITTLNEWNWVDPNDEDDTPQMATARAHYRKWKQVETLIPIIAAIRTEEQHWAQMERE